MISCACALWYACGLPEVITLLCITQMFYKQREDPIIYMLCFENLFQNIKSFVLL